jgi:hypothetical protein
MVILANDEDSAAVRRRTEDATEAILELERVEVFVKAAEDFNASSVTEAIRTSPAV